MVAEGHLNFAWYVADHTAIQIGDLLKDDGPFTEPKRVKVDICQTGGLNLTFPVSWQFCLYFVMVQNRLVNFW